MAVSEDCPGLGVEFLRRRLYVATTLIPAGFESLLRERARYINAQTSVAIEGNPLAGQPQLFIVAEGERPKSSDEMEITNLQEAYELIAQVIQDPTTQIDHGLIRTLNSIILRGIPGEERNRGRYRPGPSLIVDHRDHDIIRYRPSEPEYVNDLMDGLIADIRRWLEEDVYPPPVVAALAHFGIISIHPFDEGNGRTARLLADIILNQYGWSAEGMVSVSQAIMRDREAYYEALRETQGEEFAGELDVCPFVTYHTTTLDDAASKLEDTAINFRKMVEGFQGRVGGALNRRQPLGVLYMATIGPYRRRTIRE